MSWLMDLDLAISSQFFDGVAFQSTPFQLWLFTWGPIPSYIAAAIGIGLIFTSKWRKTGLLLFLTLALGSGLLVNGVLKPGWGRPRPRQVIEFGGSQPYRPFYHPNFSPPERSLSFPCGHAAAGFYFFSLVAIGRRQRSRALFWLGWGLSLLLGLSLSYIRIAMGGHFFTDTIFSALTMGAVVWLLDYLIYRKEGST